MKICKTCSIEKPLAEFYTHKSSKNGKIAHCKACVSAKRKAVYCPEKNVKASLKSKYGLSKEDYDKKLKDQNYKCEICGTTDPGKYHGRFCVDHNHATKEIRGLLCHNCNSALGNFKDNISVLLNAVNYLNKYGSYG